MKVSVITGDIGQLGPIWVEVLREMGFFVYGIGLPQTDISDYEAVEERRNDCLKRYGPPEVIVLNAAIDNPPGSEATFFGNLERILEVNLTSNLRVAEAFLPAMIANGGGVIVGITSIQAFVGADWRNYQDGFEKPVGYNLSKAAMIQAMRSITVQYGRFNVRGCAIGFGPYDGGKLNQEFLGKFLRNVPLGRPVSAQSCRAALRFAVECPEFAGQTVMVEGGYLSL